jgi:outer membrane protein assembly factor BamD (BamD/ComL family)
MRPAITSLLALALAFALTPTMAQQKTDGPTDEKAQKTYKHAFEALHDRRPELAIDDFKKADKQDGGRCLACQKQMIKYGIELGEWKNRRACRG